MHRVNIATINQLIKSSTFIHSNTKDCVTTFLSCAVTKLFYLCLKVIFEQAGGNCGGGFRPHRFGEFSHGVPGLSLQHHLGLGVGWAEVEATNLATLVILAILDRGCRRGRGRRRRRRLPGGYPQLHVQHLALRGRGGAHGLPRHQPGGARPGPGVARLVARLGCGLQVEGDVEDGHGECQLASITQQQLVPTDWQPVSSEVSVSPWPQWRCYKLRAVIMQHLLTAPPTPAPTPAPGVGNIEAAGEGLAINQ